MLDPTLLLASFCAVLVLALFALDLGVAARRRPELVLIETTDIVFALDSIPAIFAVTDDPFIVYTSNVFAVAGLRSLYGVLSGAVGRLVYLRHGLGAVLLFVAGKLLLHDVVHVPTLLSLGAIVAILAMAAAASLWRGRAGTPTAPVSTK